MPTYASETKVSSDRSRAEIERTLMRYGATGFGYMVEDNRAAILFKYAGRTFKILLPLPPLKDYYLTANYRRRTDTGAKEAWEQAKRQRWRALALFVKSTCEAIESGIVTRDEAWLPWTVLPSGQTVHEWLEPQLEAAARSGQMPTLLPAPRQ